MMIKESKQNPHLNETDKCKNILNSSLNYSHWNIEKRRRDPTSIAYSRYKALLKLKNGINEK